MLNCDSSPVDLLQCVSLSITAACMTATYRHFWFSDLTFNMWCSNHLGKLISDFARKIWPALFFNTFWALLVISFGVVLHTSGRSSSLGVGCLLFCSLSAIIIWALRRPINGWWCCIAFIVLALFGDHCCTKNWSGWQSDDFQMVLN